MARPGADRTISIEEVGQKIAQERKMLISMNSIFKHVGSSRDSREKQMALSQLDSLRNSFKKIGMEVITDVENIILTQKLRENQINSVPVQVPVSQSPSVQGSVQPLPSQPLPSIVEKIQPENSRLRLPAQPLPVVYGAVQTSPNRRPDEAKLTDIEELSVKRLKKKEEKVKVVKERKASAYMKISSNWFYGLSDSLIKKGVFEKLKRDLIRSNMEIVPTSYISAIFFSTFIAAIVGLFIFSFFLFFSLKTTIPFISFAQEGILPRLLKFFWIVLLLPAITFMGGYLYPSAERKSIERRIDHELPFATIHMSAISSSMIEPSKLFGIIISTGEYPRMEKELNKLQNEINIYGYDLVTALRNRAYNSPSKKLSELFNGLATTITSGGNLPVFFDKRAQSLLFDYRLDMEKQSKAAETFMDIYISVVIASPMVLMLLLMMMRVSGLGLALSPGMITFVIVAVVSAINFLFLGFLQVKQSNG